MLSKIANFNINTKESPKNVGEFSGYASVFNTIDHDNEVVVQGAFKNVLDPSSIRLLWQHKSNNPVGVITSLKEDEHGLYISGLISLEIPKGLEVYMLVKNNIIKHMSIGYQIIKEYYKDNIKHIYELKLWEISFVTFPSNENARIHSVKSSKLMHIESK
ncbi:MAG: HK97 family phage prohead protease, partial [Proteobacteria bacterium]|nr:HK97 family phage prohead protease [Pseudomonadota bacterium]